MNMGDLSTFCSILWSLSLIVCSSPCRGHLNPLLCLFLGIWFFWGYIINGIVFLYSFSICSLLMYEKAIDFCKLILYPVTLLKLFMVSGNFGVEVFFWFLVIGSCCHKIGTLWVFLYIIEFLLFILLAVFLWLGIPGLCWIGVGRVGILVMLLTLREMVSVFPY
jgi:hypothetical protein